jgi:hypothetical protein
MAKATPPKSKKPKAAPPPPKARATHGNAFAPRVTVRMYCHGLGDCFLLRFEPAEGEFFNVLLDCGIYKASPDAGRIMNDVVDDVIETTATDADPAGHLHLLVVTHEHWDHISGFAQALDKFEAMRIDDVWQAWTEDEQDPTAAELLRKYKKVKARLTAALRAADAGPAVGAAPAALAEAFEVMGFFGVERDGGAAGDAKNDDAYARIKAMIAAKPKRAYRAPGEAVPLGDTGVTAFVLGPPKDVVALAKDDPGAKDGYHKQAAGFFDGMAAMLGAIDGGASAGEADSRPFAPRWGIPVATAAATDYFRQAYAFGDPDHPEAFRAIDDLAVESLGHLALRLDSHVNNTSLVLAFRLPSGRVLLFPGDAQAGNWKSWAGLDAPLAFPQENTDAHELLRNTVLYKVAHHGSHNATPRTYGLELMTHRDLRAMVPVDHAIAAGAGYGEMPLVEIMTRLNARTNGACVRSDTAADAPPGTFVLSKKQLSVRTSRDGEPFDRHLYCETAFDLQG